MPKIYQKQLNLWIRGWHSITDNEISWGSNSLTLQISRAGPFFARKKRNRHCFRIQHCNRTTFVIWIYETDKLHSIELAL